MHLDCFKAYDVRGVLGEEVNENVAYRIGRAFAEYLKAASVVIGGDVRLTSEPLKLALAVGLIDGGAEVIDLGVTGTEEIYFATQYLKADGGIEITASHNPINCNGMKLVKSGAQPISGDTGLVEVRKRAEQLDNEAVESRLSAFTHHHVNKQDFLTGRGRVSQKYLNATSAYCARSVMSAYVAHMLSYVDENNITPMRLVVNAGNGAAGKVLDAIEAELQRRHVPITFIKIHHQPDSTFPNGIPNPLLTTNRTTTSDAVKANGADMGIAWDGDFDRCFLFDEKGNFVDGYYIVGLLAQAFLDKQPDAAVIFDPRLYWNTQHIVQSAGGVAIKSKTGHAIVKERMRLENAIYGGEMSGHHYFRDFAFCDSGMIPWLLVAELLCTKRTTLSCIVGQGIKAFPSSGEINRVLTDPDKSILCVLNRYKDAALDIDYTDGIDVCFENWRFNLRKSNTEPLVRLNVETRGNIALLKQKTAELLALIEQ